MDELFLSIKSHIRVFLLSFSLIIKCQASELFDRNLNYMSAIARTGEMFITLNIFLISTASFKASFKCYLLISPNPWHVIWGRSTFQHQGIGQEQYFQILLCNPPFLFWLQKQINESKSS